MMEAEERLRRMNEEKEAEKRDGNTLPRNVALLSLMKNHILQMHGHHKTTTTTTTIKITKTTTITNSSTIVMTESN